MSFCHLGKSFCSTQFFAFLLLCNIFQAESVSGQDPDLLKPSLSPQIAFVESRFPPLREGYVSLEWNVVETAESYRLSTPDGQVYYQGSLPKAFVSGLSNGQYTFHIEALGPDENRIAISELPAIVNVEHWSMFQAMLLFSIGGAVLLALVVVLLVGAIRDRGHAVVAPPAGGLQQ
ncbi:MAG: hypothetical protein R3C53_01860 [Pirellulaceae bacterium]